MRWEQLEYLREVAKTGSMTATAEALYVSPQAVSGSLKNLEHEIGKALFQRESGKLVLTEAGEAVLRFSQKVEQAKLELDWALAVNPEISEQHISVASSSKMMTAMIPQVMGAMHRQEEKQRYSFSVAEQEDVNRLLQDLKSRKVNIALVTINTEEWNHHYQDVAREFTVDALAVDRLVCVTHEDYREEAAALYPDGFYHGMQDEAFVKATFGHIGTNTHQKMTGFTTSFLQVHDLEFCRNLLQSEKSLVFTPEVAYRAFLQQPPYSMVELQSEKPTILHLAIYAAEDVALLAPFLKELRQRLSIT